MNTSAVNIAIVGAGNLGSSLAHAWQAKGFGVTLVGRDHAKQRDAISKADCIFLTVQDSNIESVCQSVSPWLKASAIVAHCSGALGNDALASAQEVGCAVASAHPLNTFPSIDAGKALLANQNHASYCFISGSENATNTLEHLFSSIGFNTAKISSDAKVAYHAASVFACNYLTSLAEASLITAESAGLDRALYWQAVQPLMLATLHNISAQGTAAALSGPIARGDIDTINHHLSVLSDSPEYVQQAYRALGRQAVALAAQQNGLDKDHLSKLNETLS